MFSRNNSDWCCVTALFHNAVIPTQTTRERLARCTGPPQMAYDDHFWAYRDCHRGELCVVQLARDKRKDYIGRGLRREVDATVYKEAKWMQPGKVGEQRQWPLCGPTCWR